MAQYNLKKILATFTKTNGKRRSVFNKGPIGGLSSDVVTMFFFFLPLASYGLLFNPYMFNVLGIVTSIVAFIVSLSIVMIVIFFVTWKVKENVIRNVSPSWDEYFEGIDLRIVLSKGITPYSDFFKYYAEVKNVKQSEEDLHKYLLDSFEKMKEDNKELLNAMIKDNKII